MYSYCICYYTPVLFPYKGSCVLVSRVCFRDLLMCIVRFSGIDRLTRERKGHYHHVLSVPSPMGPNVIVCPAATA